ncbi:MAG TPA: hypothetical protein VGL62_00110 [Vicinamibacterales bacterium]
MAAETASAATSNAAPAATADSGSHPVATSNTANKATELHVDKYEIASTFDGTSAPGGHQFVIVSARWHNVLAPVQASDSDLHPDTTTNGVGGLGAGNAASKPAGAEKTHTVYMPYLIPDMKTQLQLLVNGESGATLVNADFKDADLLSPLSQQINHGTDVTGRYIFDVAAPVSSLELACFDKEYGNIRIPIAGNAAAATANVVAGPMSSGGLTLSVVKVDESDTIGDTHAPAGARFLTVTVRGQGDASIGNNYLEIDPDAISRLVEADGHMYHPAPVDTADDVWSGPMKFVPGTPQRGRLIFLVQAQHGALSLLAAVPGQAGPMRLPLSPAAAAAPKPPSAIETVPDGSTGVFYLYGVHTAQSFGGANADSGQQFVILDVGIENHTGSGMEFQTKEQIELLNGDATINATDDDLTNAPRALPENGVVPPHTLGRFDIPFRVPAGATGLTLYYRGFDSEKKIPLPAAR